MSWTTVVLFLHILLGVLAFGPALVAFAFLGQMGGKEPMHANFALRVIHAITSKVTIPLAVALPILGVILILLNDWNFFASEWLWIASIIYALNFSFALFVQSRRVGQLIGLTSQPPPAGAQGPPANLLAIVKKVRMGGVFLSVNFVVMLLLMVWKPGGVHTG